MKKPRDDWVIHTTTYVATTKKKLTGTRDDTCWFIIFRTCGFIKGVMAEHKSFFQHVKSFSSNMPPGRRLTAILLKFTQKEGPEKFCAADADVFVVTRNGSCDDCLLKCSYDAYILTEKRRRLKHPKNGFNNEPKILNR